MTSNKFTKGPWQYTQESPNTWYIKTKGKIIELARVFADIRSTKNISISREEAEANARLIAAAPYLLEALKNVRRLNLHLYEDGTVGNLVHTKIEDAIKKAVE